jgi:ligand-binding SRPBCC domain-containing protein
MLPERIQFERSLNDKSTRMTATTFLPQRRARVFSFFCDAFGLGQLTPSWLQFRVLTPRPVLIERGTIIDYQLRLHGISIRWQSRIEVWEPPVRFVDVQMRGPYRQWRHEHVFEEAPDGTICRDIVDYQVPGGWLVERFVVRRDILRIFEFRERRLKQLFASPDALSPSDDGGAAIEKRA